jgi:hypothetical protein
MLALPFGCVVVNQFREMTQCFCSVMLAVFGFGYEKTPGQRLGVRCVFGFPDSCATAFDDT